MNLFPLVWLLLGLAEWLIYMMKSRHHLSRDGSDEFFALILFLALGPVVTLFLILYGLSKGVSWLFERIP